MTRDVAAGTFSLQRDCRQRSEMADTEFDDTSVDSDSFNDDNSSDRSSNISVDLYDSDGEPLPGSVAPYELAVDGYRDLKMIGLLL